MIIDFRLRPPFKGYLKTGMYADKKQAEMLLFNNGLRKPPSAVAESMDMLFEEMEENGIDMGVSPGRMGHFKGSVSNDDVMELVALYPKKFIGLAGLNAGDVDGALKELERTCIKGSLKGVCLEPGSLDNPIYANDKSLFPIYEECAKHSIPVMLMCGGRAGPDISYSFPLVVSDVARAFPTVKFIISHGGWPWVQPILGACYFLPNVYLSPDLYLFGMPGSEDYIKAAHLYMRKRFLYGSAYPFAPLSQVNIFKKMFSAEVLPDLLCNNAVELLNLSL